MNGQASQTWFAVDVIADPAAAEAVEYAFNLLSSLGTEINDFRRDQKADICVVGYFNDPPDDNALMEALDDGLRTYGLTPQSIRSTAAARKVENTDWLAEWKRHWKPTTVGLFVIAPPWETVEETDKIVVRIEPNMAFGTGTHETTQLCLRAIGDNYRAGQTFLDVGTGTGILAIAAAKMFDGQAIAAYETDADAVAIARENAVLNGVGGRIGFFSDSIGDDTPVFDLVCANLTIDVIVPLLPLLLAKTRVKLVLSGILVEQEKIISSELERSGISDLEIQTAGEWISVIIVVNQPS